jgi:hypothetical protein
MPAGSPFGEGSGDRFTLGWAACFQRPPAGSRKEFLEKKISPVLLKKSRFLFLAGFDAYFSIGRPSTPYKGLGDWLSGLTIYVWGFWLERVNISEVRA